MDKESVIIQDLAINIERIDQSYFAFEFDSSNIPQYEHNDLINDWHIEHIRRLNATAEHLIRSLSQVQLLGDLLSKGTLIKTENGLRFDIQKEHRFACRDAVINIDIYIEAIKSFCRYYFFMDPDQTDSGDKWYQALLQYKSIKGWDYINSFLSQCKLINEDRIIRFLTNVRNNEVHSESPIELIRYKFEKTAIPIPVEYVISNQDLHNNIAHASSMLTVLSQRLQIVIENISPTVLYAFLSDKNGELRYIMKMEDRYKREREVFASYNS